MTTREAIAICREQAAKESGPIREALLLCAAIAEHHANRNRKNKQRHVQKGAHRVQVLPHQGMLQN